MESQNTVYGFKITAPLSKAIHLINLKPTTIFTLLIILSCCFWQQASGQKQSKKSAKPAAVKDTIPKDTAPQTNEIPDIIAVPADTSAATGSAPPEKPAKKFMTGADQVKAYTTALKGKKVAVVANQSSMIGETHLIDSLIKLKINVVAIFSPEHGLRGDVTAGQKVENTIDDVTGLPVISLYGDHLKPTKKDMKDVDFVLYDIQDVGARFYTYISTLHNVMEACAENGKQLIILDRPNPNGFYIDGPVLKGSKSFVGMDPIPIVYGMTPGELAGMINLEGWIKGAPCRLKVIKMKGYTHDMPYNLPVWPSPNLNSMQGIYLYPSLCLFEGTKVSVGRGTERPFTLIGFPDMEGGDTTFTPISIEAAPEPMYQDTLCSGLTLASFVADTSNLPKQLNIGWLITMYQAYPNQKKFFTPFFDKLAGGSKLREQIQKGVSEEDIRASWEEDIKAFTAKRKRYLLYPESLTKEKKAKAEKTQRPPKSKSPKNK